MQYLPGKRVLALVFGLAATTVGSAYAQDTTETGRAAIDTTADTTAPTGAIDTSGVDTSAARDTTDTSGVQNPPGYRGMERDTTVFPDTGSTSSDTGAATGVYPATPSPDTAGGDTTGGDTTSDTTSVGDTEPVEPDAATPRLEPGEDTASQTPDSMP